MTPRRRIAVLFSLVAVAAAAGFTFTYWVFSQQAERFLRSPNAGQYLAAPAPARRIDPLSGNPVVTPLRTTPATVIVRRAYYPECGDEVVVRETAGSRLAGKTSAEVARSQAPATVETFTEREVVLLTTVPGACPKHASRRYLGVSDGHVAVFQGRPGTNSAKVLEVFDLETSALPEREVQDLRRGVQVSTDDELKRVLQSYLELVGF